MVSQNAHDVEGQKWKYLRHQLHTQNYDFCDNLKVIQQIISHISSERYFA